ncbi:MAG: peptidyl-alpha-hydroxyglycine alpha-amidating lyase family protein [Dehalococcoidia bacterium]
MVNTPTATTKYIPVAGWAKIPHGLYMREATSVAVDSEDHVYIFSRGNMPVMVFDRDGNMIDGWGNDDPYTGTIEKTDPYGNTVLSWPGNRFVWAHSIRVDHEDNLWLVDVQGHQIHKTTKSGEELMVIGTGEPAVFQSGDPFNRPTDVTIDPNSGDVFISDGYRNSRVHRYDSAGNHKLSWGSSGDRPGEFSLPHNIAMFGDDAVIVCDRENHRVQVFSLDGEFRNQWHVHKAVAVWTGRGEDQAVYVAEQGPPPVQHGVPNLGHHLSIFNRDGELINRIGAPLPGEHPDQFLWPHSVAVDSHGDIYVAEVSYVEVGSKENPPREMVSLRKWQRVSD